MKLPISASSLLAAVAIFTLAIAPLQAQTNSGTAAATVAPPPAATAPAELADSGEPLSSLLDKLIPIVAIVMGCSIPIVVVTAILYFSHRKTKMLHETIQAMVEKGVPIPPELLAKSGGGWSQCGPPGSSPFPGVFGPTQPRNDLRTGLLMTGLGIGLMIFIGDPGAIVLFLGIAFIIVGIFTRKKTTPEPTPKP